MIRRSGAGSVGLAVLAAAILIATASARSPEFGHAPPPAGATPTRAVCPASISVQFTDSFGNPRGQPVAVTVARFVKRVDYEYLCQYERAGAPQEGEYYVVVITSTPPGVPGRIPSGDCARTNPNPLSSEKRYLLISGGPRKSASYALPSDLAVLSGALRAAEAAGVGRACPGTSKPPPPPPPPPKPTPGGDRALGVDYSMPNRFGLLDEHGVVDYQTTRAEIAPPYWRVDLHLRRKDRKPCRSSDIATVRLNGVVLTPARLKRFSPCYLQARVPKEGTYRVVVRLRAADGVLAGERTIVVQDWLIIGLGDSNGSGEGTPDVSTARIVGWQSIQCHRSANSFEAKAARKLELRDPRTSVTFVHLACSGATITRGLLGAYEGIEPRRGPLLRPQVLEAKRLAFGREIDAVLISIGVNDLMFGKMAAHCITHRACETARFPSDTSPTTLGQKMTELVAKLPGSYARLSRSLSRIVAAPRVYVTEYFDSTRDERKQFCNPLIFTPKGSFDQREAGWAYSNVLVPLNAAVRAAAGAQRWGYVSGPQEGFASHGYCSSDSWIVKLTDSYFSQGNTEGTLHANRFGNDFSAARAVEVMRPGLYPNGRTRRPAP